MDWNRIYNDFPVNQEMIWLNNCGTTPAGQHHIKQVTRFLEGYAQQGIFTSTFPYNTVKNRIKSILGDLLNCKPSELALIHNTAEGMNFISHGLQFDPGDEMILLANEYPSNYYPWLHLRDKGVTLITAPMGDSPDQFWEGFSKCVTTKTRAVALSAVHWCTGMPLPLERIGQLCDENQIIFILDGAQGVGIQPIDVNKFNIDYMAFSAWKWLMGPLGLGIMYVSEKRLNQLKPIFIGTDSVVDAEHYLPYKSELKPDTDRFVYSTANYIDWVYFLSSLEFLSQIGFQTVRERIFELCAYLAQKLTSAGFKCLNEQFAEVVTGVMVFNKPQVSTAQLFDRLKRNKIVAAERLGNLRFSPHVYNSFEQLEKAVEVIC